MRTTSDDKGQLSVLFPMQQILQVARRIMEGDFTVNPTEVSFSALHWFD